MKEGSGMKMKGVDCRQKQWIEDEGSGFKMKGVE